MTASVLRRRKYLILILTLVCVLAVQSFAHRLVFGPVASRLLVTLAMLAVFLVVFQGWRERTVAFGVAAAAIVANWLHHLLVATEHEVLLAAANHVLMALFLGFAAAVILRTIFEETTITGDEMLGSACGYLLAAGMWANVYALTEVLQPGSFSVSPALAPQLSSWPGRQALFNYFSLVTLTTMGYGDVTPLRPPATALAMLEAVFGQFYIAVVVAQLVALRLALALGPKDPPAP